MSQYISVCGGCSNETRFVIILGEVVEAITVVPMGSEAGIPLMQRTHFAAVPHRSLNVSIGPESIVSCTFLRGVNM
jgi:hypothetical protein